MSEPVLLDVAFAPELAFERPNGAGGWTSLGTTAAVMDVSEPGAGPAVMGVQTGDVTLFTQAGELFVPRGSDLRAGDRVTWQGRKYELMGVPQWDQDHPFTGDSFGWMLFTVQVDGRQLIADMLALRGQQIVLTPIVATGMPGGGKDYGPGTARAAQTFVVTNLGDADAREGAQADRGLVRKLRFQLVGVYNSAIEIGDTWDDDAASYTVESIDRTNPFNVVALVVGFLKETGHS